MGKELELLDAVRRGNTEQVSKLIGHSDGNKKRSTNSIASRISRLHRSRKPINVNCTDRNGDTPLHIAAVNGYVPIVTMLLSKGADVSLLDYKGYTPLHMAAWSNAVKVCEDLIHAGGSVNQPNHEGDTPLHTAAQAGLDSIVGLLLQNQASMEALNEKHETPMDLAAKFGRQACVRRLLDSFSSDPDSMKSVQHSPLHLAARHGHQVIVQDLLDAGVSVNLLNYCGTALHEAVLFGRKVVVNILLNQGINTSLRNHDRQTAVELLKEQNLSHSQEIIKIIEDFIRKKYGDSGETRALSSSIRSRPSVPSDEPASDAATKVTMLIEESIPPGAVCDEPLIPVSAHDSGVGNESIGPDVNKVSAADEAHATIDSEDAKKGSVKYYHGKSAAQSHDGVGSPISNAAVPNSLPFSELINDSIPSCPNTPSKSQVPRYMPMSPTSPVGKYYTNVTPGSSEDSVKQVSVKQGSVKHGPLSPKFVLTESPDMGQVFTFSAEHQSKVAQMSPQSVAATSTNVDIIRDANSQLKVEDGRVSNKSASPMYDLVTPVAGLNVVASPSGSERTSSSDEASSQFTVTTLGTSTTDISDGHEHRQVNYENQPPIHSVPLPSVDENPYGNLWSTPEPVYGNVEIISTSSGSEVSTLKSDVFANESSKVSSHSDESGAESSFSYSTSSLTGPIKKAPVPQPRKRSLASVSNLKQDNTLNRLASTSEEVEIRNAKSDNALDRSVSVPITSGTKPGQFPYGDYVALEIDSRHKALNLSKETRFTNGEEVTEVMGSHVHSSLTLPKQAQGRSTRFDYTNVVVRPELYEPRLPTIPQRRLGSDSSTLLFPGHGSVSSSEGSTLNRPPPSPNTASQFISAAFHLPKAKPRKKSLSSALSKQSSVDPAAFEGSAQYNLGLQKGAVCTQDRSSRSRLYENLLGSGPPSKRGSLVSAGEAWTFDRLPPMESHQTQTGASLQEDYEEWQTINGILESVGAEPTSNDCVFVDTVLSIVSEEESPLSIETWLYSIGLPQYENTLIANGFDNIYFLGGSYMDDQDLDNIGIQNEAHQQILLKEAAKLKIKGTFDEYSLPPSVDAWLRMLELPYYIDSFMKKGYCNMERIWKIWEVELVTVLEIRLIGHRKRILTSLGDNQGGVWPFKSTKAAALPSALEETETKVTISSDNSHPSEDVDLSSSSYGRALSCNNVCDGDSETDLASKDISPTRARSCRMLNDQGLSLVAPSSPTKSNPSTGFGNTDPDYGNLSSCFSGDTAGLHGFVSRGNERVSQNGHTKESRQNGEKDQCDTMLEELGTREGSFFNCPERQHWPHQPKLLLHGCLNYDLLYLGTQLVPKLNGVESTKEAISIVRANAKPKIPSVTLSISYKGVKFIESRSKKVICEHEISNIFCAVQDGESLTHLAYITRDLINRQLYCHVFSANTLDLAREVILTLGAAFEVAYCAAVNDPVMVSCRQRTL